MKLKDLKGEFYYFTGELTKIIRNMAFSGIAIVWILKSADENVIYIDKMLIIVILSFISVLIFDFLQYLYQAIFWSIYYRYQEKKDFNLEREVTFSTYCNLPSWIFFTLKIISLVVGFGYLFIYLYYYKISFS